MLNARLALLKLQVTRTFPAWVSLSAHPRHGRDGRDLI